MSSFFPHTAYAEDQPLAKTILTTHVIHRGAQTGTTIGIVTGSAIALLQRRKARSSPSTTTSASSILTSQARSSSTLKPIERSAGRGFLIGAGLMAVMLPFYMAEKEDIEWADRSWRLLENEGQVEVDSWSLSGAAAGLATSIRNNKSGLSWRPIVGRTAIGSMLGVSGYMVWRYGVMRGERNERSLVNGQQVVGGDAVPV